MEKKDISVGILDIDSSSANTLKEKITGAGYSVFLYSDPEQLISNIKLREINVIIIECITTKLSLDKVVEGILSTASSPPIFIFMSLILDQHAVQDSMIKTQSKHFFKKPIHADKILEVINSEFKEQVQEDLSPSLKILTMEQPSHAERVGLVKGLHEVHGYDLPRIISYLMRSSFSGVIKLSQSPGKPIEIQFHQGTITRVLLEDPKSFFGALLVDKNFVSIESLDTALQKKSKKRIGERLVEANLISPHVIDIINSEQLGIRIGSLIKNTSYEIETLEQDTQPQDTFFEIQNFEQFLSDWIFSNLSLSWLKTFYLPWMENTILKSKLFADISPIYNLPPLNRMPKFSQILTQGTNLSEVLDAGTFSEEDIMVATHVLVVSGFIYFDKKTKATDFESQVLRLKKIKSTMDNQTHFEVLGLSERAKVKEVKRAYYDLSKIFHPDKVAGSSHKELIELTNQIFSKISMANEVLSEESSRLQYLKELKQGESEKILESESLFEEGKSLLKVNQTQKAIEFFEKSMELRPPTSEIRLHHLWCKILLPPAEGIESYLTEIELDLNRIPPEDRHNSTYYFVKGLFNKHMGDMESAEKNMKQALSMQSNYIEAQRELNIIRLQKKNKPVDIMNADLKDVVGMLFKKKK